MVMFECVIWLEVTVLVVGYSMVVVHVVVCAERKSQWVVFHQSGRF